MPTNVELEKQITNLSKLFQEQVDAIRRLGQENNNLVSMVSKLSDELNTVKGEVSYLKGTTNKLSEVTKASVNRYE